MNELELILTDICACSRAELYRDASAKLLNERQLRRLEALLRQRGRAVPVQYGLGYADFMGLVLKVNKHVLIPRPETEQLVEYVLQLLAQKEPAHSPCRILDIGTGSGCIAIALAKYSRERLDIIAVDISKKALMVAYDNARVHSVLDSIQFVHSDFFSHDIFKIENKFDIIVSNPPYVPTKDIGTFDITTQKEPKIALDGGFDGCDAYRRLSTEVLTYLEKDGLFVFEIGEGQSRLIREIFSDNWVIERFIKDYRQIERICIARPKD